jgi:hypothetical protein
LASTATRSGSPACWRALAAADARREAASAADLHRGRRRGRANRQVILSYGLWQLCGGRDDAVGQTRGSTASRKRSWCPGAEFFFIDPAVKLWRPLAFTTEERSDNERHSNNAGRWSAGCGRARRSARRSSQIDALNARNLERFPAFRDLINAGFPRSWPLQEGLTHGVRKTLLLWGGVVFVLLIGVVNITSLVLVRSVRA